jgi:hypothetical protein
MYKRKKQSLLHSLKQVNINKIQKLVDMERFNHKVPFMIQEEIISTLKVQNLQASSSGPYLQEAFHWVSHYYTTAVAMAFDFTSMLRFVQPWSLFGSQC